MQNKPAIFSLEGKMRGEGFGLAEGGLAGDGLGAIADGGAVQRREACDGGDEDH